MGAGLEVRVYVLWMLVAGNRSTNEAPIIKNSNLLVVLCETFVETFWSKRDVKFKNLHLGA